MKNFLRILKKLFIDLILILIAGSIFYLFIYLERILSK